MKVTSPDGTSIGFDVAGSGPALVMVDAAGCFRGFGPTGALAAALTADFTVISYDRRGRGESTDTLPYAVEREVEDLRTVIDGTGGSAFVYGFSSGAVLALHAAARGLPVQRMALLEPPVSFDPPAADAPDLGAEIVELVAAGRRGDAIEHFHTSIGVPAEMVAGLREHLAWPALEGLAHTLVYDTRITGSMSAELLATVTTPTLVVDSEGSDDRLRTWAKDVADILPNGRRRSLAGEWHGPAVEDLAAALVEFFTEASK